MNQFLQAALTLGDMGYRVFPCKPGEKAPATAHGCLDATSDTDQIATWWTEMPDANIGLATDGLYIVDVDPLRDGSRNSFADDIDRLADLLHAGYGTATPRGGQHFWFRQFENQDLRNSAGQIADGVDARGNGGYVLVPPSRTVDGEYHWIPGFELDSPPDSLPPVPLWVLNMLSTPKAVVVNDDGVSVIGEGGRNNTLTSIAGMMRRNGLSERAIESALRATNLERCRPPLDDAEVSKIAWSVSRYEPDQFATAAAEGWYDEDERQKAISDPGALPDDLLMPEGLIGEIVKWSAETAYMPQPELSLAATICLMSALTGRKIADQTGLRTNLYCMGLCESGGGKEHTRKVNKSLLRGAGLDALIGPEGFGSHAGIIAHLKVNPVQLFQVDEFGRFLATLNNPGKSPHLYNVVGVLLKLFTSADSLYIGDAVADTKRVPQIDQPHAVLYATTVAESFLNSLSKESLSDGFVSRLLVFESRKADPDSQDIDQQAPPEEILDCLKWWATYSPGGNLAGLNPQPRKLTTTPEAKQIFREMEISCRAHSRSGREASSLWTRTVEKARKLAMIHAVSQDMHATEITPESAEWGCRLSWHSTARMEWMADGHVSENFREATMKRLLRMIRDAGPEGLPRAVMFRKTAWIATRERNETIEYLKVAGLINEDQEATGGRRRIVYRMSR